MKRKRTRRQIRQPAGNFDYQTLEPRQLLAGDLAAMHQIVVELPTGINQVQNGDFETFNGSSNGLYDDAGVAGWSTTEDQQLNLLRYSDDYTYVLDLDSTAAAFDSVYQKIDTVAAKQYLLSFDFRAHPTANPDATERSYDFEVFWEGELVGEYSGGNFWQTGSLIVTANESGTSELMFREIAEGDLGAGDGMGALLDNVRVVGAGEMQVNNGGFESTRLGKEQFFRPFEVDGWGAMGADRLTRLIKIEDATVGAGANATEGEQYLNLDTTQLQRDIVFQNFDTEDGATYYVVFDLKGDGPQTDRSDELRVRWSGQWATTIHPVTNWQTYGLMVQANSNSTRLTFLEPGDGNHGEGSGVLIDDVRIFRVDPEGINEAPEIEQLADQAADFAEPVTFSVVASDPENQQLTYVLGHSLPADADTTPTISQTGEISWTPSTAGTTDLTVTVLDKYGKTDRMTFSVDVAEFVPWAGDGVLANLPPEARNDIYREVGPPELTIDTNRNFEARFTTSAGIFSVDLYAAQAPQTVNNFVLLARDGFYHGIEFHRVIEGFMAQSGDALQTGRGGPGYTFADETDNGLEFDEPYLLAMANRGPGTDTNGSQFFLTFGTPTHLNGNHTIFGKINGDLSAFMSTTVTHDVLLPSGQEIPRSGIDKTIIESITIHVT